MPKSNKKKKSGNHNDNSNTRRKLKKELTNIVCDIPSKPIRRAMSAMASKHSGKSLRIAKDALDLMRFAMQAEICSIFSSAEPVRKHTKNVFLNDKHLKTALKCHKNRTKGQKRYYYFDDHKKMVKKASVKPKKKVIENKEKKESSVVEEEIRQAELRLKDIDAIIGDIYKVVENLNHK